MFKKAIIAGLGGLVVLGLVFGRDSFSHVKTSVGRVRKTVRESVPVDF